MEDDQNDGNRNQDDMAVLIFDVDDAAIERAAKRPERSPLGRSIYCLQTAADRPAKRKWLCTFGSIEA